MHCPKMHATMTVSRCIANRLAKAGQNRLHPVTALKYPCCKECPTGDAAARGELDDADVLALRAEAETGLKPAPSREARHAERTKRKDEDVKSLTEETQEMAPAVAQAQTESQDIKRCTKCGETKPLEEFHRQKDGPDGRESICKVCKRDRQNEHYRKNKDAILAKRRIRRSAAGRETKARTKPAVKAAAVNLSREGAGLKSGALEGLRLVVDLSLYPEIFEEIRLIAESEDRTPEAQVRHWLRKGSLGEREACRG